MAGYLSDSIMNDVPSSQYSKQSTQVSLSVISARIAVAPRTQSALTVLAITHAALLKKPAGLKL